MKSSSSTLFLCLKVSIMGEVSEKSVFAVGVGSGPSSSLGSSSSFYARQAKVLPCNLVGASTSVALLLSIASKLNPASSCATGESEIVGISAAACITIGESYIVGISAAACITIGLATAQMELPAAIINPSPTSSTSIPLTASCLLFPGIVEIMPLLGLFLA